MAQERVPMVHQLIMQAAQVEVLEEVKVEMALMGIRLDAILEGMVYHTVEAEAVLERMAHVEEMAALVPMAQ